MCHRKEERGLLWGGLRGEGKRQSSHFHALHHIFKLSKFIIGLFSCIMRPGTLKPNWLRVFQRFTLGLPLMRQPHNVWIPTKKTQVKTPCRAQSKKGMSWNETIIQGSESWELFNLPEYQFPLLKPGNETTRVFHCLTKVPTFSGYDGNYPLYNVIHDKNVVFLSPGCLLRIDYRPKSRPRTSYLIFPGPQCPPA